MFWSLTYQHFTLLFLLIRAWDRHWQSYEVHSPKREGDTFLILEPQTKHSRLRDLTLPLFSYVDHNSWTAKTSMKTPDRIESIFMASRQTGSCAHLHASIQYIGDGQSRRHRVLYKTQTWSVDRTYPFNGNTSRNTVSDLKHIRSPSSLPICPGLRPAIGWVNEESDL